MQVIHTNMLKVKFVLVLVSPQEAPHQQTNECAESEIEESFHTQLD